MLVSTLKDNKLIKNIVSLHLRAFPSFFLSQLGEGFLGVLYEGFLDDPNSGIIAAKDDNGSLIGFLAFSYDYSAFFKGLIKHRLIKFVWYAFLAAIRHPSFSLRLVRALGKSHDVKREEEYVEIASIAVEPESTGNGIGTLLIRQLILMIDFTRYDYISLETDAEDNEVANRFYIKNGFQLERMYVTPEGRAMNEYRYRGNSLGNNSIK